MWGQSYCICLDMHLYPPALMQCGKKHCIQKCRFLFSGESNLFFVLINTFLKYPKYFSVQLTFDINHKSQQDKQPWLSPSKSLCQVTHRRQVEENKKALQLWLFALFSVTNLFWLLLWVAHLAVIQVTLLWILSVTVPQTFNEKVTTMWAGEQNILASGQGGGGNTVFWGWLIRPIRKCLWH